MRITLGSQFIGFDRHLDRLNTARNKSQIKISTGKDVITLSDDPEKIVDVRKFDKKILQNEMYMDVIDMTKSELYMATESIDVMGQILHDIKFDALNTINQRPMAMTVIASKIEGHLDDLLQYANQDYQGHFIFAGTKTTVQSLDQIDPSDGTTPYELVREEPTAENPSGIRVVYHGNNKDRIINKSSTTTEVINAKQENMFGPNNEIFDSIVGLINSYRFNANGERREDGDTFNAEDIARIENLQRTLSEGIEDLDGVNAELGTKIVRMEDLSSQMADERVRLRDYKSLREDVDIAEAMIDLKRQDAALEYSLQIGSRMIQTTLFDFLR